MTTVLPCESRGSFRTGRLEEVSVEDVVTTLGFESNVADDDGKVENSWAFTVDGSYCCIWDYYGSHTRNRFSTYGPSDAFNKLFPGKYHHERS